MSDFQWCAVDAEGDYGATGLLGVAIYSDRRHDYITAHDSIVEALYEHAALGYTFLCHNASYDVPVVWGQLGLHPEITYFNDRLHHASWRYDPTRKLANIWDTLDLSGGLPLWRLGDALGIPKYTTPQKLLGKDYDKYEWKCDTHNRWECEECYAVRDAEIVYKFMIGLETQLEAWGIEPQARLAGTALNVWKSLDSPAPIGIKSYPIRELARCAYYGGRTETFKLGHITPLYTSDVTSMYPSIMASTPYPDPSSLVSLKDIPVSSLPLHYEGVAQVDVSIPSMYVPPLPHTRGKERIYPIGRLIGTWTLLELRYAVSVGCRINAVKQVVYAEHNLTPFTNFVGVLWAMREEYKRTNDPRSLFAKLMLNNLYGRLGTTDTTERKILKEMPPGWDSTKKQGWNYKQIGEMQFMHRTDNMSLGGDWCNVMWAAQTTSGARIKLHKLLTMQGDGLVYCDTDSVFSRQPIQGVSQGLGQLEAQGHYKAAIISYPKLYALQDFDGKWNAKAKGVPQDTALRFLHGETVSYRKAVKPTEALRRGLQAGEWIVVNKGRHAVPYRRQPIHPDNLLQEFLWSDTVPPVYGPLP